MGSTDPWGMMMMEVEIRQSSVDLWGLLQMLPQESVMALAIPVVHKLSCASRSMRELLRKMPQMQVAIMSGQIKLASALTCLYVFGGIEAHYPHMCVKALYGCVYARKTPARARTEMIHWLVRSRGIHALTHILCRSPGREMDLKAVRIAHTLAKRGGATMSNDTRNTAVRALATLRGPATENRVLARATKAIHVLLQAAMFGDHATAPWDDVVEFVAANLEQPVYQLDAFSTDARDLVISLVLHRGWPLTRGQADRIARGVSRNIRFNVFVMYTEATEAHARLLLGLPGHGHYYPQYVRDANADFYRRHSFSVCMHLVVCKGLVVTVQHALMSRLAYRRGDPPVDRLLAALERLWVHHEKILTYLVVAEAASIAAEAAASMGCASDDELLDRLTAVCVYFDGSNGRRRKGYLEHVCLLLELGLHSGLLAVLAISELQIAMRVAKARPRQHLCTRLSRACLALVTAYGGNATFHDPSPPSSQAVMFLAPLLYRFGPMLFPYALQRTARREANVDTCSLLRRFCGVEARQRPQREAYSYATDYNSDAE